MSNELDKVREALVKQNLAANIAYNLAQSNEDSARLLEIIAKCDKFRRDALAIIDRIKPEPRRIECPECHAMIQWPRADRMPFCTECGGKIGAW